jgi:hypothetical protein
VPQAQVVDDQDLVERLCERRQLFGGTEPELDAARTHGRCVAPGRLPHHDGRVLDTAHETLRRPTAQLTDRNAWPEADLQDTVGGLHPEQADGPLVALAVRRP